MSAARNLRVVAPEPDPPEAALAELVPQLIELERSAARVRIRIDHERQRLAKKRGVAFIRPEHIRREFS